MDVSALSEVELSLASPGTWKIIERLWEHEKDVLWYQLESSGVSIRLEEKQEVRHTSFFNDTYFMRELMWRIKGYQRTYQRENCHQSRPLSHTVFSHSTQAWVRDWIQYRKLTVWQFERRLSSIPFTHAPWFFLNLLTCDPHGVTHTYTSQEPLGNYGLNGLRARYGNFFKCERAASLSPLFLRYGNYPSRLFEMKVNPAHASYWHVISSDPQLHLVKVH